MRYFYSFIMVLSLLTCNISCDKEEVFITWEQECIETSLSIGSELYAVVGDTLRIYFQSILLPQKLKCITQHLRFQLH